MKIAVFHNLPCGGAKRALYNLVKYLGKAGNVVDAFIPSTADENFLPLNEVVNGCRTFSVQRTVRGVISSATRYAAFVRMSLADHERVQERIAQIINAGSYDIVLSDQDQFTSSPFLLKFLAKPTVHFCHQPPRSQEAILQQLAGAADRTFSLPLHKRVWLEHGRAQISKIDKENAAYAAYIVTNSCFTREAILRVYGRNAFVSYLGVDTDFFRPLSVPEDNYVLSVGACCPHKGYDFVIRSLALTDRKVRPKLVIVSNGMNPPWEAYLTRLAVERGVELEIKTLVTDSELVQLYNRARLLVYAPYLEPFGLAPLEAMACGKPVVGVKEGGVRESVVPDETGILTERDEKMFAHATAQLLQDDERRRRMGSRALEVVRTSWTWAHAGERLDWHLRRAANLPGE